jgi:predicted aconitase with swiveling domain
METILKGHGVGKGTAEGEAVVTRELITNDFINPTDGIYNEKGHELDGRKVGGKVLVFPVAKGSSVVTHSLLVAKKMGNAPIAMIFDRANPIQVHSAILSEIPAVYGVDESAVDVIENGATVKVDADNGIVEILG